MKNINRLISLALFSALVFFVLPVRPAAALGPQAGNCSWGNYGKSDAIYLSANSGTSNEDQINAALKQLKSQGKKSVYLKAGTYIIDAQIVMPSGSVLEGDKDAVIKLRDHAGWKAIHITSGNLQDPLIGPGGTGGTNAASNIEVKCITIDGNAKNNESSTFCDCLKEKVGKAGKSWSGNFSGCESSSGWGRCHGNGYYTLINFTNGSNFSFHDLYMRDGLNDGLRLNHATDVKFYNNNVDSMGHEGVYAIVSHGLEVYGNNMKIRGSNGVRGYGSYDYIIRDNVFQAYANDSLAGNAGIQIAPAHGKNPTNIQIYRNIFYQTWQGGVWLIGVPKSGSGYGVSIHHNLFHEAGLSYNIIGTGGVISESSSSIVYNNVFDGVYNAAIYALKGEVKLVNNIITGTQKHAKSGSGGVGIYSTGTVYSQYNCFYQNTSANYNGSINKTGDLVNVNPLFADQSSNDYHLKSRAGRWDPKKQQWVADSVNSPCIDAGAPFSSGVEHTEYSKEPANNGGRRNIGWYGNTSQASLTGNSPQSPMPPAPKEEDYPTDFSSTGGGGSSEPDYPIYPYSISSILPDLVPPEVVIPSLPDEEVPVTPLYPTPDDAPNTATSACMVKADTAGLIPCGKSFNDPATSWNECQECGFCSFVLMIQLILERLIELAGILALLMLIASGAYHVVAAGNAGMLAKAKSASERAVYGFIMVLVAWLMVDFVLSALGFIDPVGGKWHIVCEQSASSGSSDTSTDNSAQ